MTLLSLVFIGKNLGGETVEDAWYFEFCG